ncbi:acyl-CoA mutase large subunit family protein [Halosquirtibacter laminarini]|uniref:Acyl-CoA mutase large subunit family protein n=1 Tax=Halosquirtibacter laminarini TaxID=3374600 RepID=A0AC61NN49_9BACT|nr:acyl-CoA mutase large subunit family protein [Prolixibacteraceae bacterium]
MAEKNIKLFEDFPPISTEQWTEKITADLKGRDFERALVWRTNEGFNVQPFYREENLESLNHLNQLPGEYPFVRGAKKNDNDWYVRQNVVVENAEDANTKALDILNKGITSLGFILAKDVEVSVEFIQTLLKGIDVTAIEVNFVTRCKNKAVIDAFVAYLDANKVDATKVAASVANDPIGRYVSTGKFAHGEDAAMDSLKSNMEAASSVSNFRTIAVNAKLFNNCGSSISQELGYGLALGAEYISEMVKRGVTVDAVASDIKFNFATGANYFMELAKLRAGRMLWAQIVKAFGAEDENACKMLVHSETSQWNKSAYDPYVNMLRTQTEAMSSILGGTDSMTVNTFDKVFGESTDFSERIARNQQLLLKEESHFDKIVDPGAGSYYIESLTESIAEQAWEIFLSVQEKGGFMASLKVGSIQDDIKATSSKRDLHIATRRENVLGVNQFPNFTEHMDRELTDAVLAPVDETAADAEIATLATYRGAEAFEALRYKTDLFAKENKRPLAYMLTIGSLSFRKARAQFSCNFFAVAGMDVQDNNGFKTIDEGVKAAKEAGADVIVLCSSDDEYEAFAPEALNLIQDEAIFVVAGAPKCMDELKAKGIENFIHVKSNLLEDLKGYTAKLGIK